MTLVGYFNSLRELDGMRRATDDSVNARLRRMTQRGLENRFLSPFGVKELTSRLGATDIPDILDQLETPFDPAEEERPKGKMREKWPIDVLLATNMISVGVDINRLGLMVTAGQPKTTAEYIQATSRVGRSFPGLVCTVYNWTRPRDLSHYESFEHYHATYYQHVESLSVTPFSTGAMQRGLTALLVAYLRLAGTDFNPNKAAEDLVRDHPLVAEALARIPDRAERIMGGAVSAQVRQALESRLDRWLATVAHTVGARVGYRPEGGNTVGLLKAAGMGSWETFTCLNSLRNVEPTVRLILNNHGMDRVESRAWIFEGE